MTATRNVKTLEDYPDNTISQFPWESFVKIFMAYLADHGLNQSITNEQKKVLFHIANDYLGWRSGMRDLPAQAFLLDYRNCEKLMERTNSKLKDLQAFLKEEGSDNSGASTASLARDILTKITRLRGKLEDVFNDQRQMITGKRSLLSNRSIKTLELEFTIDLERFITLEFSTFTAEERNILIGATFAEAGLDLDLENLHELIPTRVSRAKEYYRENYSDPGVWRVYSYLGARTKVKKEQGQAKSQK